MTTAPTLPDGLSAEARRGAEIADDSGCSACHRSEAVAPAFEGLYGSTVELDDGSTVVADEEYLTRAITDPGADIVAGYAAAMPDNDLTDDEVASVVAYLRELGGSPVDDGTGPMRRHRGAVLAAVTGAVMLAACGGDRELVGLSRDPAPMVDVAPVPDASRDGEPFRFVAAQDGLLVVFFGYTNCPDVCPTTLAELRRGLDKLDADDAARIDAAMVSIDPDRDRDVVADYIDSFVPGAHAVATDDDTLLQEVALAFGVSYQVTTRPNGDVDVSHSDTGLFAVDDTGTLLLTWPYGTSSDDIAGDLEQLLADHA